MVWETSWYTVYCMQSGKCLPVKSVILGFGIRNTTRGIRNLLTIGIRIPSSTDKESAIHYLESGIHVMKSRIDDCLVFPFMGRLFRPCPHVSRYFWIRNFFFPDSKISTSTRIRIQIEFARTHVSGFNPIARPRLRILAREHAWRLLDLVTSPDKKISGFSLHTVPDS